MEGFYHESIIDSVMTYYHPLPGMESRGYTNFFFHSLFHWRIAKFFKIKLTYKDKTGSLLSWKNCSENYKEIEKKTKLHEPPLPEAWELCLKLFAFSTLSLLPAQKQKRNITSSVNNTSPSLKGLSQKLKQATENLCFLLLLLYDICLFNSGRHQWHDDEGGGDTEGSGGDGDGVFLFVFCFFRKTTDFFSFNWVLLNKP